MMKYQAITIIKKKIDTCRADYKKSGEDHEEKKEKKIRIFVF
jgi:hypothetical protein